MAKSACSKFANLAGIDVVEEELLGSKLAHSRWTTLIQKVYEIDPLECPKCGGEMRIIAFIESRIVQE